MAALRRAALAALLPFAVSCAPEGAAPAVRFARSALLSELGPFHLRVFPKAPNLRCDAAMGAVLVGGRRDPAALPGRNVQPAERCGADWARLQAMYGTASPVDACMGRQTTVAVPAGTYVVLVTGQGQFRRPTGETRSGVRGAACAEVTLGMGATSDITLRVVEQADDRAVCGDGMLDSNETCDLGPRNGMEGSGCASNCQTVERAVNNNPRSVAGNQRHPAVSWGTGLPLVVAFDVSDAPEEDVRARYFNPEGASEGLPAALAQDVVLGGGPSQQLRPAVAPLASPRAFVAAWETLAGGARNALAETFDDQAPRDTTPPRYVSVPVAAAGPARQQPAVAASGQRVLVAWREGDGASGVLRAATFALAMPLGAPSAPVTVASGATGAPRAAALPDGGFALAWSAAGDIFVRKVTAAGALAGDAALASPVSAQVQDQPALASVGDGTLVVAWRDEARDAADNDGTTVRWARLGANLQRVGDARTAPTTTAGNQSHPAVAVGGGAPPAVLLAWEDEASGHVRGRLVRADGSEAFSRVGGSTQDFAVSAGDGPARHDPVAAAGGATVPQFAVAWEGADDAGAGVRVRVFPQ